MRGNYISGQPHAREKSVVGLTAEAGEKPEEERKSGAENQASDDGEIESGVLAAVDNVAGKAAEAEREFVAEIKYGAEDGEENAEDEEGASEIAERIHKQSVEELWEVEEVDEVKEVKERGEGSLARERPRDAAARLAGLRRLMSAWKRRRSELHSLK
jgi:hypothetical protein